MLPFLFLIAVAAQAQPAPSPPKIDLAKAKRVYDNNCAGCHGPEGSGGKGPALAVSKLRRGRTDEELGGIIQGGIPGTGMPPSWHLGMEGVTLAVVYVRTIGKTATPPKVEGDIAQGKVLYETKGGCAACHTIGAGGHAYGPDLSSIGASRSAANLRESLVNPAADVPDGFLYIRATPRAGAPIDGVRVNEDTFTIQIVDASGRVRSFRKSALLRLERRAGESPMPSYKAALSETELQNLVAYLSSLRGEQ